MTIRQFFKDYKFELLLFGLFQHLFMAMVLSSLEVYRNIFWPINMVVLGVTSFGVYLEQKRQRLLILRLLVFAICSTPLLSYFVGFSKEVLIFLSISYSLFFGYVFHEVLKFLIKPSYINKDAIMASGCGYFLLIEMATFVQQTVFYFHPLAYKGLDLSHPTAVYVDFVYLSTVTITSIGFGDILPNIHYTKLLISLIGIIGQFYMVVLVGILISKFTSQNNKS
jgi:hypothetical protein